MQREIEPKTQKLKPKPAPKVYLQPDIGGTRIAPKPTLAELDGEPEC